MKRGKATRRRYETKTNMASIFCTPQKRAVERGFARAAAATTAGWLDNHACRITSSYRPAQTFAALKEPPWSHLRLRGHHRHLCRAFHEGAFYHVQRSHERAHTPSPPRGRWCAAY